MHSLQLQSQQIYAAPMVCQHHICMSGHYAAVLAPSLRLTHVVMCCRSSTIAENNGTHAAGLLFLDNSTAELHSSFVSDNYASSNGAGRRPKPAGFGRRC
jgi:hypothetical protein